VIENWYNKLSVAVRWISAISGFFSVVSGVRQGNILSPRLLTVLINTVFRPHRMHEMQTIAIDDPGSLSVYLSRVSHTGRGVSE